MTRAIGISIEREAVRAVEVQRGRIRWAAEMARDDGELLAVTLCQLLSGARRRHLSLWQPRVVVALGPSLVQTKCLRGLPAVRDARMLTRVVRESSSRFFLRNGVPLVTTDVRVAGDGQAWAAATDESTMREVLEACASAKVAPRRIVPAVAVLGAALVDGTVLWPDGSVVAAVTLHGGTLSIVRCVPHVGSDGDGRARRSGIAPRTDEPVLRPVLATLGNEAWRYAAAFGAATAPVSALDLLPPRHGVHARVPRWRLAVAGIAAGAAFTAALLAPGLRAAQATRVASRTVAALGSEWTTAESMQRELGRMTAALEEVSAFMGTRRSHLSLLSQLTRALPQQSALVSLHVDSAGGTLVALAPHAADILHAVERVPDIVNPQILGPVTQERDGDYDVERVSLRFAVAVGPHGRTP